MRRLVVALMALAAVAVAVSTAGVFASGGGSVASGSVADPAGPMPMPMPAGEAAAAGPTSVQLHRRVVRVKILNFAFVPARVVVSAGTRVVWTNEDEDPHTVTSDTTGGGLASEALNTGGRFTAVMRRAGTIAYHCEIHPFMHGTVVVEG